MWSSNEKAAALSRSVAPPNLHRLWSKLSAQLLYASDTRVPLLSDPTARRRGCLLSGCLPAPPRFRSSLVRLCDLILSVRKRLDDSVQTLQCLCQLGGSSLRGCYFCIEPLNRSLNGALIAFTEAELLFFTFQHRLQG
jgi:hypothetical protein